MYNTCILCYIKFPNVNFLIGQYSILINIMLSNHCHPINNIIYVHEQYSFYLYPYIISNCNVNTISNMLHLLTPSSLPCHAMLYRILMTLYFYTCMIMNVKDLFLTPPALNMNYYLYCITYCNYG